MAQLKSTNILGNLAVAGNVVASSVKLLNGTNANILLADGSTKPLSEISSNINLSSYLTKDEAQKSYLTSSALSGYATEKWVTDKKYLTTSNLTEYATQDWVNKNYTNNIGTVTSITAGTGLSGGTITNSGTISLDPAGAKTALGLGTAAYKAEGDFLTQNISTHIYMTGAVEGSSTSSTSQLVFGTSDNNHIVLSSNKGALVINPSTTKTSNQIVLYLEQKSDFPYGITSNNQIDATSFNVKSDIRLKENFQQFIPKKSILDLPIYKFDFINGSKNQIGCKAQDLQEICPEIVTENEDGYLSIQESKIIYLLIDEIKKLKSEINSIKAG